MLRHIKTIAAYQLPLNNAQRKLIAGIYVALATFSAKQAHVSIADTPFDPALTAGFVLSSIGLTIFAILALRGVEDEDD